MLKKDEHEKNLKAYTNAALEELDEDVQEFLGFAQSSLKGDGDGDGGGCDCILLVVLVYISTQKIMRQCGNKH